MSIMANTNQGTRAGQVFGRLNGDGFAGNDWENVVLKPGYIIKIRDRFALVEAVEGLSIDLYFNDAITVSGSGADDATLNTGVSSDETRKAAAYGAESMGALIGVNQAASKSYRSTVLSPDYDSGYTVFNDLEPFKGHLYHLCPSLPAQPKFMGQAGDMITRDGVLPSASTTGTGIPIGFPGAADGLTSSKVPTSFTPVGSVSPKLYVKHPAGVPKFVLDESPESESGSTASGSLLGLSGFIDAQISPVEDPDWSYSMWIEHGENNLPAFRAVVDCEEYILDGRVRLQGWKYRIVELTMSQLRTIRERSGGRLVFKVINPAGLPTAGTMLSEYFPQ